MAATLISRDTAARSIGRLVLKALEAEAAGATVPDVGLQVGGRLRMVFPSKQAEGIYKLWLTQTRHPVGGIFRDHAEAVLKARRKGLDGPPVS